MKTKIVDETFDENRGITKVTIQNKYGHFTGYAYCSPIDSFSAFQGERIAVTRANIEFCKTRIKQEKIAIKTLDNLLKDFYFNSKTRPEIFSSSIYRHTLLELNRRKDNVDFYTDSIKILKSSIKKIDDERQNVLLRAKKNK